MYYLFEYLEKEFQFPGASLFGFLTFRAALAIILSLLISTIFGKKIINILSAKQVGETIRDLGLNGQKEKKGTPTMGGLIIIMATIIPVLLFSNFENTKWYKGSTLVEALENVNMLDSSQNNELSFPVQWVNRSSANFRGYSGTITDGKISKGDFLCFKNAGAYGYNMSSNYNSRLRPLELCIHKNSIKKIREKENLEDLLKNQIDIFKLP